jgi:pimeloyl-ACP methyl ester carboxylesterase
MIHNVGNRPGHYRAFIGLLRNAASWEAATKVYGNINVPVHLIWGDKDWARSSERDHDRSLLAGAHTVTVENGGHFLPLDRPDVVIEQIQTCAGVQTPTSCRANNGKIRIK